MTISKESSIQTEFETTYESDALRDHAASWEAHRQRNIDKLEAERFELQMLLLEDDIYEQFIDERNRERLKTVYFLASKPPKTKGKQRAVRKEVLDERVLEQE